MENFNYDYELERHYHPENFEPEYLSIDYSIGEIKKHNRRIKAMNKRNNKKLGVYYKLKK